MPKGTARERHGAGAASASGKGTAVMHGAGARQGEWYALAAREAYNVLEGGVPSGEGKAREDCEQEGRSRRGGGGRRKAEAAADERSVAREAGSAADEPLGASRSSRAAHAARLSMSMAPRVCTVAAHAAAAAQGRSCSGGRACSAAASARLYAAWAAEPSSATACMWRVRI